MTREPAAALVLRRLWDEPTRNDSAASGPRPILSAIDSEWTWYVQSHDEGELLGVDEPAALVWEKLWMREIRASQAEDYGLSDDDPDDHVFRNRTTGRFEARTFWIECPEGANDAVPWMGVKYAPGA